MTNGSFQSCSPALHCDFYCTAGETGQFLHRQKQKVMKCLEDVDFLSAGRKRLALPIATEGIRAQISFSKDCQESLEGTQAEPKGKATVIRLKSFKDVVVLDFSGTICQISSMKHIHIY